MCSHRVQTLENSLDSGAQCREEIVPGDACSQPSSFLVFRLGSRSRESLACAGPSAASPHSHEDSHSYGVRPQEKALSVRGRDVRFHRTTPAAGNFVTNLPALSNELDSRAHQQKAPGGNASNLRLCGHQLPWDLSIPSDCATRSWANAPGRLGRSSG